MVAVWIVVGIFGIIMLFVAIRRNQSSKNKTNVPVVPYKIEPDKPKPTSHITKRAAPLSKRWQAEKEKKDSKPSIPKAPKKSQKEYADDEDTQRLRKATPYRPGQSKEPPSKTGDGKTWTF